jgi:ATP-binding cassette, subfamily B, bacterial MsbA
MPLLTSNLRRTLAYFKPYRRRVALGMACALLSGVMEGAMPLGAKLFQEVFLPQGSAIAGAATGSLSWLKAYLPVWSIPLGIIAFTLVQGIFTYGAGYFNMWAGSKASADFKLDLYRKLTRLEIRFFENAHSGELLARFHNDVDNACNSLLDHLKLGVIRGFSALFYAGTLLVISWKLALAALVILGATFLPIGFIRKRLKRLSQQGLAAGADVAQAYHATHQGARLMSVYNLQERFTQRMARYLAQSRLVGIKSTQLLGWITPITHSLAGLGVGLVLLVGTLMIQSGELTFPNFSAFVGALLLLYTPIKTLGNTSVNLQQSFYAMERVFALLDTQPAILSAATPQPLAFEGLGSGLCFEGVSFAYTEGAPVLKAISLQLKTGQTMALVGASGSGKSSLVSLIPRFYDPTEGRLTLNGIDLREFPLEALRGRMAYVFQQNLLLAATLRENVTFQEEALTPTQEQRLRWALDQAYLSDWLATLPHGLETVLGDKGQGVSGGQLQRLAIARAFYAEAPLLIFDEATSALDTVSEKAIQQAMARLMQARTVVVIAHRLSTIQHADTIVVLHEGRLVEQGSHEALLRQGGLYQTLYQTQFLQPTPAL